MEVDDEPHRTSDPFPNNPKIQTSAPAILKKHGIFFGPLPKQNPLMLFPIILPVIQVNYEFWRDTFNFHFGHSSGKKIYFEKFWPFHNSSFIIHHCPVGAH